MEHRADLHCHTTFSDGTSTPLEVVQLAKSIGLTGLSITDHDTFEAYNSILPEAAAIGIDMISGVEFSCVHRDISIHVLGYAFSLKNLEIKAYCQKHKERRDKRFRAIIERLAHANMPVNEEEVREYCGSGIIGRPHIALAMVKKGFASSIEDAFKTYLGAGKPCFVPGEAFPIPETLEIIKKAGGVAIIAHPQLIKDTLLIKELLKMDFDGLEGYYSRFEPAVNERWVQTAKQKNWIITGGSDFHGSVKPRIPLGCAWAPSESFDYLKQLFIQSQSIL